MKGRVPVSARCRGMVSMPAILAVAMILGAGLTFAYRNHLHCIDNEAKAQVRVDYTQKEEAVLRALLHLVPNKAIGAMQQASSSHPQDFTWTTIFEEAAQLANAESAVSASLLSGLGAAHAIVANPGDTTFASPADFVSAISGDEGLVNPGLTQEVSMLFDPSIGDKLPAPLQASDALFRDDATYPIISLDKTHSAGWRQGLLLSPADYPLYNLYSYPNIRFGYARPGQPFVAKRNWWAFALQFGAPAEAESGMPVIKKHYVLSIYEVPSQLPIAAAGFMNIGRHADGSGWGNVGISGGVFARRLQTEGTVALVDGLFSARTSTAFSDATSVAGRRVEDGFDALGVREQREAETGSNFHDASIAGNTGNAVFIPLNRGNDFLELQEDGLESERISPTGWNLYSTGAGQARMRVRITQMDSIENQVPVKFDFSYLAVGGNRRAQTYERGVNWPADNESGGSEFPFQTDHLSVGRRALVLYLDRLPAFLAHLGDAADSAVNNSIYIYPDSSESTVKAPSMPSSPDDLAVSMSGGEDMSAFPAGFSLVTNLRLYIGASVNAKAVTPPSGSGLAPGTEYYPPVSFFASEKRFGSTATFVHPLNLKGQLNSLKTDENDEFRPLDFRAGNEQAVDAGLISAELKPLRSPAELAPVHLMNWLVVIEEVHLGRSS